MDTLPEWLVWTVIGMALLLAIGFGALQVLAWWRLAFGHCP